jgi:predicted amidohydrolase
MGVCVCGCADLGVIGIVPGTIVESHRDADKDEDKLLNVAYFIDHEGNIAGKYVKKNLWYVCLPLTPQTPIVPSEFAYSETLFP